MRWHTMKNANYSWISLAGQEPLKTDASVIKNSVCLKKYTHKTNK